MTFSQMLHGPFALPITQYQKPHQAQQFLVGSCCLMSLTLPIVELLISQYRLDIPMGTQGQKGKDTHIHSKQPYFDKTSATVGIILYRTRFSHYPHSQYIVYNSESKFKRHFDTLCDSYVLKHKPVSIVNPQTNVILKKCIKQSW